MECSPVDLSQEIGTPGRIGEGTLFNTKNCIWKWEEGEVTEEKKNSQKQLDQLSVEKGGGEKSVVLNQTDERKTNTVCGFSESGRQRGRPNWEKKYKIKSSV